MLVAARRQQVVLKDSITRFVSLCRIESSSVAVFAVRCTAVTVRDRGSPIPRIPRDSIFLLLYRLNITKSH